MKTAAAVCFLLIFTLCVFAGFTENFTVFTKEQARRLFVTQHTPILPSVVMLDSFNQPHNLREWVKAGHKAVIVEFFYTRCSSICRSLGSEFQQMQREIVAKNLQNKVSLFSISFDPNHDTPPVLDIYAKKLQADPGIWRFATLKNQQQLSELLDFFDITVIPDEFGGYQHNAALLFINPNGQLVGIADYTAALLSEGAPTPSYAAISMASKLYQPRL